MSWEPDTSESNAKKTRDEIEKLRQDQFFNTSAISSSSMRNSMGTSTGTGGFSFAILGDIIKEVTNDVVSGLGELREISDSYFSVVPDVSEYGNIAVVNKIANGTGTTVDTANLPQDGQLLTLRPQAGKSLTLKNNATTGNSYAGNLLLGSDITLTETESITLRYQNEVKYADTNASGDKYVGGWIVHSSGNGITSSNVNVLKDPVKVASTGNNSLHPAWGATIDGIGMVTGDRFLIKDQTTQADNGIYIWGTGALGISLRASDMSDGSVQKEGTMTYTQDGNTQAEILYAINIGGNNITIGTNANTWGEIGSGSGGGSGTIKSPCKYATTANIILSGEQSIDGTATSTSRVLVKNQTTASQNGIYVTASGSWSRSTDMATASTIEGGTMVYVTDGTVNGDNLFGLTTEGTVTVGTGNQAWANLTGGGWVGTASSSLNMVTFPIYGQYDIGGGQTNFINTDPTVGLEADLDMNTYDIKDVCRIGFELGGTAVQNTISGISTSLIPSTTNYSMHFNVPDDSEFKFTTYGRNRFRVTDSETKIYTENGGATYERLTVDNLDMWVHNIDLSPTTNSQDLGGDGSGSAPVQEQWRYVYGNNFKIINHTSNITTTTEGGVFMNATNGLTLKSYDLGGTNFGSATFTDKDGSNRIEFNYDMSSASGNAVFNYMRQGFKIRTNNADTDALLIYPRQNSFATNDVIIDAVDSSANGAISMKINSSERFRISMTDTTIKASTTGEINMTQPLNMSGGSSGSTHYNTISAGSVLPKAFGYTLGASGSGVSEKGWGSLYLTTEGSNADKGKITLNDHGATYMKFDESTGISLVTDDALSFTSVSSVLWYITASTGMTFVIGGATTHTFQDNALSLGSGVDLVVSGNLLDFTNRATPTAGSISGDGAIYSKSVSGVDTPMWWDGTTETSMLGGGSSSGGGVNASYIWTNDETNEYDQKVYLSNATMGSSSGMNNVNARLIKDNIYYIPIYFSKACTIDEIGYECTISGGSSVQLRFGLYSNRTDNQNYPYQLIDGGSDFIYLSATTGASRYPLGFGKTLSVPSAGLFWVAINNTNNTSTTFRIEGGDVGGVNTVGHVYNSTANPDKFEPIQAFKESDSGNMPSTAGDDNQSIGFGDTGNRAPVIFLRVS